MLNPSSLSFLIPLKDFSPPLMSNLREQREAFANSMIGQGLLDQQFSQLLMVEEDDGGFLVELMKLFCSDSERLINELSKLLDQPVVDFQKVDSFVHQLKGSSSSVGANRVKMACIYFRQFCDQHDKQGCLRALNEVNNEYYRIKTNFNTMLQFF